MSRSFALSVVAPDRTVVEDSAKSLVAPSVEGYVGILAGHVPLIAALQTGLLEYNDDKDQRHFISLSGGFMEVSADSVIVLADTAERSTEIDVSRAERALERARSALRGEDSSLTSQEAAREMDRALNRLKVARMG